MSEKHKQIVNEINNAFTNNDSETFLNYCSDDVTWTMIGEKSNKGKTAIREWLASMGDFEPPKFTVDKLIADDTSVVCFGDMSMKDKSGTEGKYSFCDVYEFKGDEIVDLRSFVVKLKDAGKAAAN